jgi:hypothetical protein
VAADLASCFQTQESEALRFHFPMKSLATAPSDVTISEYPLVEAIVTKRQPNQPHAANPAMTPMFHAQLQRRGVADAER